MAEQTNLPERKCVVTRDMSEDARVREAVRIRERALHDEATALNNARREERESIIGKMRLAGMSDEQINSILGL